MGNLKPFRSDILILAGSVALILLIILAVDVPRGMPQWYYNYYHHEDDDTGGGGNEGTDGAGPEMVPVEEALLSVSGHTNEGQSSSESFTIDNENTTQIRAVLVWMDDIGDNDQLSLGLLFEGENVDTVSSTSGQLELVHNNVRPGEYQLVVTAVDCPGAGMGISPLDRDGGNDWQLSASATVMKEQEGGQR